MKSCARCINPALSQYLRTLRGLRSFVRALTPLSLQKHRPRSPWRTSFLVSPTASREYLRRERARRPVAWREAIQIAQAGEIAEPDCSTPTAAAAFASAEDGACSREGDATIARAIADKVVQQQATTALQQATLALQQATAPPM